VKAVRHRDAAVAIVRHRQTVGNANASRQAAAALPKRARQLLNLSSHINTVPIMVLCCLIKVNVIS
jgi:hypothetical protein